MQNDQKNNPIKLSANKMENACPHMVALSRQTRTHSTYSNRRITPSATAIMLITVPLLLASCSMSQEECYEKLKEIMANGSTGNAAARELNELFSNNNECAEKGSRYCGPEGGEVCEVKQLWQL